MLMWNKLNFNEVIVCMNMIPHLLVGFDKEMVDNERNLESIRPAILKKQGPTCYTVIFLGWLASCRLQHSRGI